MTDIDVELMPGRTVNLGVTTPSVTLGVDTPAITLDVHVVATSGSSGAGGVAAGATFAFAQSTTALDVVADIDPFAPFLPVDCKYWLAGQTDPSENGLWTNDGLAFTQDADQPTEAGSLIWAYFVNSTQADTLFVNNGLGGGATGTMASASWTAISIPSLNVLVAESGYQARHADIAVTANGTDTSFVLDLSNTAATYQAEGTTGTVSVEKVESGPAYRVVDATTYKVTRDSNNQITVIFDTAPAAGDYLFWVQSRRHS